MCYYFHIKDERADCINLKLMIKIKANGREYSLKLSTTISRFIEEEGRDPRRVVVEYNGRAMKYSDFKDIEIKDGDRLEIMNIVAGG